MKENGFNFFQDHSLHYLEMAFRSDRQAMIENPDAYGKRTGDCGDTVEFFLQISENAIQSISFLVNGCINTTACCNTVAQLVEGRSIEEAWGITPEKIIAYLETLPPDHMHCAELSVGALYLALSNFQERNRDPWKKLYQR
jgi:nitrogen fixation NifU-like protein